jgi:hypothetical protein
LVVVCCVCHFDPGVLSIVGNSGSAKQEKHGRLRPFAAEMVTKYDITDVPPVRCHIAAVSELVTSAHDMSSPWLLLGRFRKMTRRGR